MTKEHVPKGEIKKKLEKVLGMIKVGEVVFLNQRILAMAAATY